MTVSKLWPIVDPERSETKVLDTVDIFLELKFCYLYIEFNIIIHFFNTTLPLQIL